MKNQIVFISHIVCYRHFTSHWSAVEFTGKLRCCEVFILPSFIATFRLWFFLEWLLREPQVPRLKRPTSILKPTNIFFTDEQTQQRPTNDEYMLLGDQSKFAPSTVYRVRPTSVSVCIPNLSHVKFMYVLLLNSCVNRTVLNVKSLNNLQQM